MARSFCQALTHRVCVLLPNRPLCPPRFIRVRSRSSQSSGSGSSEPLIRKLEEAIQCIIARRSAPDWLAFRPGSSYWVPPLPSGGSLALPHLLDKLANPLSPEESLSTTTLRGWPSSSFFIQASYLCHKFGCCGGAPHAQIIDSVDVTCGLSLGEYTALAFAGAFSFEDGLKLVKLRGEAMQDAARSAMVSVIGLDAEKVQLLCNAANEEVDELEKVQIANFLCPGNYAVSGGEKGVEAVQAKAKSFNARMTVRLAVAGAFHTGFMDPAVSRLEAALTSTEIRVPRIPVISNVDAQPHADPAIIKNMLARQVTSPVQWETTVKNLLTRGLKKTYELGPGKVIAGTVKRMDKNAEIENIGA